MQLEMKENKTGKGKRLAVFFLKTPGGIALLIAVLCAILLYLFSYLDYTTSYLGIINNSGLGVRFERVMIDDKVLRGESDVIIASGSGIMHRFRAPEKIVELKVVVVNEMHEEETLSCELDNRGRPHYFAVYYSKGSLVRHY